MTVPRRVMPGRSLMITRRCTQRMFLLRPDAVTNEIFLFCLGVAAERFGIEINWVAVESNHYHAGIHDPDGSYPEFLCYFHALVARAMNVHRGRRENFWSSEQTHVLELLDAESVFHSLVYGLTNPVKDHLVDKVFNWPGVSSLRYQLASGSVTVKRPSPFFSKNGDLPEQITVRFVRPREFEHLSEEEWQAMVGDGVFAKERALADERVRAGIKVVGRKAVRRQSPFSSPKTPTPRRPRKRVAGRDQERCRAALQQHEEFVVRYRVALRRKRDGEDALFPAGTYLLRVRGLVNCEPHPPPN
jgi:putative transposase